MLKHFKMITGLLLIFTILFGTGSVQANMFYQDNVTVELHNQSQWYTVNGVWKEYPKACSMDENGNFYVPANLFRELFDCAVTYFSDSHGVLVTRNQTVLWQGIDNHTIYLNDVPYTDAAPYMDESGEMFLPVLPYAVPIGFSCSLTFPDDYPEGKLTVSGQKTFGILKSDSPVSDERAKISRIVVNKNMQMVTIYAKKPNGEEFPVKYSICSTGINYEDTPDGTYRAKKLTYAPSYGQWYYFKEPDVYITYVTNIIGNVCFHSVSFLNLFDVDSLYRPSYTNLGKRASAGCIRLLVEDARFIWENCNGALIEIGPGQITDELSWRKQEIKNNMLPVQDYINKIR